MTQPTVARQRTWQRDVDAPREVTIDGHTVTVTQTWTLHGYQACFTLTQEFWPGLPAASGWWLAVTGQHGITVAGTRQRLGQFPSIRETFLAEITRRVLVQIKQAWLAANPDAAGDATCDQCREVKASDSACSCEDDQQAIESACLRARDAGREIHDGTARAIVAGYAEGQNSAAAAFASTGAVPEPPSALWREIFPTRVFAELREGDLLAADMLRSYLDHVGPRGPVAGWASVWVR